MDLRASLREVSEEFPPAEAGQGWFTLANRGNWVDRTVHDIELLRSRLTAESPTVADVGGGLGLLAIGCARLGMSATVIDDMALIERAGMLPITLAILQREGVAVERRDVIKDGLGLPQASMDAISFMHVIEHLASSPKRLLHDMRNALRPGGVLMLGSPNCVNLRKRVTVPLGRGSWSRMEDWYETPAFGGHVREPDVADLRYIARDLALDDVAILGRNFLGLASPSARRRSVTAAIDPLLRRRPSLCSDLYLVGVR